MAAKFISDEAQIIEGLHLRLRNLVFENDRGMDRATRDVVISALVDAVRGINLILRRPTIRGHLNPNLRLPDISEQSSWNDIFLRLRNLTSAASILADELHLGPPGNHHEIDGIEAVKVILRDLNKNISQSCSLPASATK